MTPESRFTGCIRIQPALNDAECDFLLDVLDSDGTLRGTPTGRGDQDVPFARLAWEPCPEGCCLQWNPYLEDPKWMVESLRFVVDHLLRPGAKGEGHPRLAGFTFDHRASGVVVGRGLGDPTTRLITVEANVVTGSVVPAPCEEVSATYQPARSQGGRFDNVIEFRPRRA
ncbi:hypothetical protein [uncultured Nocardioides sp.]|uniref:hypothetical protein n=1 Tax=uncultured Nocardioides sp. TaxID=198441 RepID=UPI002630445C|nr:hypothetical protein [uncultured Nocardioides sp.]